MDGAITEALRSLLSSHSGDIPKELSNLAHALLTQSRTLASSLRGEEEIARSYTCTVLAYNRLRPSLGLPNVEERPPCPPRIFKSLYRHFDSSLRAGTKRRGRPPKARADDDYPVSKLSGGLTSKNAVVVSQGNDTLSTPTKRPSAPDAQPRSLRSTRHSLVSKEAADPDDEVLIPDWVMPMIHNLCRTLDTPAAPSHVFVGVSVALKLLLSTGQNLLWSTMRAKLSSLIVAIYLCVTLRMSGRPVNGKIFDTQAKHALEVIAQRGREHRQVESVALEDVHAWILEFDTKGLLAMDWYHSIPQQVELEEPPNLPLDEGNGGLGMHSFKDAVDEESGANGLQPGLGTMMQDKFNYFSQPRRADYLRWKSWILDRAERLAVVEPIEEDFAV